MIITSNDDKRMVDVGTSDILHAVYSTIMVCLKDHLEEIPLVVSFFEKKMCASSDALPTARQFNLVRDLLSRISPEQVVYDMNNISADGPWKDNLSEVVTSCGNIFTTADGQDMLFEIVSILCYGGYCDSDIYIRQ